MNGFQALRNKIDATDTQLLALLRERSNIVKEVKAFKNATHKGDFCLYIKPDREYTILHKVVNQADGYSKEFFYNTWRGIISASNFLEQSLQLLATCGESQNDATRHFGGQKIPTVETDTHKAFNCIQSNTHHILAFKETNLEAFHFLQTYTNIKIFSITHSLDGTRTFLCGKISLDNFQDPAVFLTTTDTGHFFIKETQTKIFLGNKIDGNTFGAFYPLPL